MNTTIEGIIAAIIGTVVGGSGIVGIVFLYIRRYIDGKLNAREAESKKRQDLQTRRLKIDAEMEHATGRLLFYIHKAIVTGNHNGDLEAAWNKYQKVEEKKKDLDREIIIEHSMQ